MKLLWFLPTFGDGRYLGSAQGARDTNYAYLRQIAEAADSLGFYGALLPTGRTCDDSWIAASALIPSTQQMRFLIAVRINDTDNGCPNGRDIRPVFRWQIAS
jgi:alkanesulfonate monooxygenase